jgi:hypothetical protein
VRPGVAGQVRWLANRFSSAAELSRFAAEQTKDAGTQQFAQQHSQSLRRLANVLNQFADVQAKSLSSATDPNSPDFSETVEDIGQAVQTRLQQRAARDVPQDTPADTPTGDRSSAFETPNSDTVGPIEPDDRMDEDADGAERANGRILDRIRQREGREGTARDRLRVVLPALRENLPEVLELVAQAVEEEVEVGGTAAWVERQSEISNQVVQAKIKELQQYQGQSFDQAYAGMALVDTLELQAATRVIANSSTPEVQQLLANVPDQLQNFLQQSRRIKGDVGRPSRREQSRTNQNESQ